MSPTEIAEALAYAKQDGDYYYDERLGEYCIDALQDLISLRNAVAELRKSLVQDSECSCTISDKTCDRISAVLLAAGLPSVEDP